MGRAQLRLRGLVTMAAVAVFVAAAAVATVPSQHAGRLIARTVAQQGSIQRLPPSGIRWY